MSQSKEKNLRKLFTKNLKDKVHEAAEKMVTEKIQKKINQLESDLWKTSRQRDWFILSSLTLLTTTIILVIMWIMK